MPARGIYDNMKTEVDRVGRGKERQVNICFLAMPNHYVFAPEFCNPAAGWEKGRVENARSRLWQQMPDFPDLAALNAGWSSITKTSGRRHRTGAYPVRSRMFGLMSGQHLALPAMFDGFVEQSK